MLRKLFDNKFRVALGILLVVLLAVVRAYEDVLFYDPFLHYFKTDYTNLPIPATDKILLLANLLLRYFLNAVVSLAIIYVLFRDREMLKFSAILYVVFFVILAAAFFAAMSFGPENKMMLFYIRRFLIQPLFLLLFIPAFYFQERASKKNNVS